MYFARPGLLKILIMTTFNLNCATWEKTRICVQGRVRRIDFAINPSQRMWEVAVGGGNIGEVAPSHDSVHACARLGHLRRHEPPVASSSGSTLSTPSSLSNRQAGPPPEISIYTHLAYAELLALSSPSSYEGGDGGVKYAALIYTACV
ncbi:hypothetical protein B0H11DRAFT_2263114 [Mycena galericulata]|nr:hypothetical protein B0H11DRAFT_2263114 [Mycena galericulata]